MADADAQGNDRDAKRSASGRRWSSGSGRAVSHRPTARRSPRCSRSGRRAERSLSAPQNTSVTCCDRHLATFKGQKVQKISRFRRGPSPSRDAGRRATPAGPARQRTGVAQGSVLARGTARDRHEEPGRWPDGRRAAEAEELEGDRAAGQHDAPAADRRRAHGAVEGRAGARGPRRASAGRGQRAQVERRRPRRPTRSLSAALCFQTGARSRRRQTQACGSSPCSPNCANCS